MTQTVSIAAVRKHNRELKLKQAERDRVLANAHAESDGAELGDADPGQRLLNTFKEKRKRALQKWLSAKPLSPEFPTLSIALHAELSAYETMIRLLEPSPKGDEDVRASEDGD